MKIFTYKSTLLLLCMIALLIQSCGSISNLPDPSSMESILQIPEYQEVRIGDRAIMIKWDFNRTPDRLFSYQQKTISTNKTSLAMERNDSAMAVDAVGLINIRKTEKDSTLIVIQNKRSKLTNWTPSLEKPLSNVSRAPITFLKGIQSNGTFSPALSPQHAAWGYLFSLPNRPLRKGDTVQWPVNFPVEEGKKTLMAKGTTRLTLTRFVKIDGNVCAQLNLIQNTRFTSMSEFDGEFTYTSNLNTTLFFDVLAGSMHSAYMDMQINTNKDNPNAMLKVPGSLPKRGLQVITEGHTMLKLHLYGQ